MNNENSDTHRIFERIMEMKRDAYSRLKAQEEKAIDKTFWEIVSQ